MSTLTSQPTAPNRTAGAPPASSRDLQRSALHDLVALATESAATEAEIERLFKSSTEDASKESEKSRWTINARYRGFEDSLRQKHEERVANAKSKYEADKAALEQSLRETRERVEREHEPLDQKMKEKLQQAIWLADSVLEVAQNQIREEVKKSQDAVKAHNEALDLMEGRAWQLLQRYGQQLPQEEPDESPATAIENPEAEMLAQREAVEQNLARLRGLVLPRMFVGAWPWTALGLLCVISAVAAQGIKGTTTPAWPALPIAVGGTLVGAVLLGLLLRWVGQGQVREAAKPLRQSLTLARRAGMAELARAAKRQEARYAEALRAREAEVHRLKQKASPVMATVSKNREEALASAESEFKQKLAALEANREKELKDAKSSFERHQTDLRQRHQAELQAAEQQFQSQTQGSRRRYDESRTALSRRLSEGLAHIRAPMGADGTNGQCPHDWSDPCWKNWTPPQQFPAAVRFGELHVDLKKFADETGGGQVQLQLPPPFSVPATLTFPRGASFLIQHDRTGREAALRTLQSVMTRLLTGLPAGRARFTIIDPVGLGQNFAGFMHLADHDEALVGTRIWTETDQIEQRLADMTEHMETVIQKYLRNEFETIDDYNAQAGELAEPYRFLVIADFPTGFQGEAFRRLGSIATSGARCGVYVLIARDTRSPLPAELRLDDLEAHTVNLVQKGDRFVWKDDVFGRFPLTVDAPPPEDVLIGLMDKVGRAARQAKRVEVPFDTIAPAQDKLWSMDSTEELQVPIGRMGATRLQTLRLGKGVAQHTLIAGKTGSGKSTLLHAIVTNLAMWYSPDQVELYLVDFKKGVEFKTYATHHLPHARAIAVESDREFGVSVLQRLDAELGRRGELFRKAGVQDLAAYRRTPGALPMPRTLLIIDEFQEFFSEDDKLAQEAGLLLDRLVRQGRAFGVHVLLGSQTIGGTSGLARSTIGQMAVRIALQTSEADSQLILGDNNSAARLLSRPGEAIYNDAGGLVEANSPFQVAWLPDERRETYLERVRTREDATGNGHPSPIVFEGNAPADITQNVRLREVLSRPRPAQSPTAAVAWLGEPVAIKEPTAVTFRRQSGANVLLVGQQDESAMAIMVAAMLSLSAQYPKNGAIFYVFDGTPADSPLAGTFADLKAALPNEVKIVEWRGLEEAVAELAAEVERRQAGDPAGAPEIFVFVYGLQRYRMLRKAEDDFSFSSSDEPKKANPGKQFADLLREGPPLGIHVMTWVDTPVSLDRTLDRASMREFDNRVLFQMSAADSSNLIDSPSANKLGFYRALVFSEEQGTLEKFRPYALPPPAFLASNSA